MSLRLEAVSRVVGGEIWLDDISLDLRRARSTCCSARRSPARPRCCGSWPASTGRAPARCWSTAPTSPAPSVRKRNVAMVYQQFVNYPSLTVYDNIASPLRLQGIGRDRDRPAGARDGARCCTSTVCSTGCRASSPAASSSACAIARALVKEAAAAAARRAAGQSRLQAARGAARRAARHVRRAGRPWWSMPPPSRRGAAAGRRGDRDGRGPRAAAAARRSRSTTGRARSRVARDLQRPADEHAAA